MNTIRLMIELATQYNWKLHPLDVKSTFLNGELKEVYLVQLRRFLKEKTITSCMQVIEHTIWSQTSSQVMACEN
jgi:hypothetical protein